MNDAELGLKLVTALRSLSDSRDERGAPVRGKLTSLVLNITSESWQAISQFWLTNDWQVHVGKDPALCLLNVLVAPDLSAAYDPAKKLASFARAPLPVHEIMVAGKAPASQPPVPASPEPADDNDLDDLLV